MPLYIYHTQIGRIGIEEQGNSITQLYFENDPLPETIDRKATPLIEDAFDQLSGYLAGERRTFSLPLAPKGTAFRQALWLCLRTVPYGKTVSYKVLATAVGNPNASRAVGQANNKNPIPIFIPCHRVIGISGQLVGYRGGLAIKKQLLLIEQKISDERF